jgi:hypothetical protein
MAGKVQWRPSARRAATLRLKEVFAKNAKDIIFEIWRGVMRPSEYNYGIKPSFGNKKDFKPQLRFFLFLLDGVSLE